MLFQSDIAGIDLSPSVVRAARVVRSWRGDKLLATAETPMPYSEWRALHDHKDEYIDALRKLHRSAGLRSRRCNLGIALDLGKHKVVDCSAIAKRLLKRLLDNERFWEKHLGVKAGDYALNWEPLSGRGAGVEKILLTAIPLDTVAFYQSLLTAAGLNLCALRLAYPEAAGTASRFGARSIATGKGKPVATAEMERAIDLARMTPVKDVVTVKRILAWGRKFSPAAVKLCWLIVAVAAPWLGLWYLELRDDSRILLPAYARHLEMSERYSSLQSLEARTKRKLAHWRTLNQQNAVMRGQQNAMPDFLGFLATALPAELRLNRVHCINSKVCRLAGVAPSYEKVVAFSEQLERRQNAAEVSIKDVSAVRANQSGMMSFLIECEHRPDNPEAL